MTMRLRNSSPRKVMGEVSKAGIGSAFQIAKSRAEAQRVIFRNPFGCERVLCQNCQRLVAAFGAQENHPADGRITPPGRDDGALVQRVLEPVTMRLQEIGGNLFLVGDGASKKQERTPA